MHLSEYIWNKYLCICRTVIVSKDNSHGFPVFFQNLVPQQLMLLYIDEKLLLLIVSVENSSFLCYGFFKYFRCQIHAYCNNFSLYNLESCNDCSCKLIRIFRVISIFRVIFRVIRLKKLFSCMQVFLINNLEKLILKENLLCIILLFSCYLAFFCHFQDHKCVQSSTLQVIGQWVLIGYKLKECCF